MPIILDLFARKSLATKKKTATEWSSPCPSCGGDDRCSVWPDDHDGRGYYWCRRCGTQGDGIQFMRDFMGLTYVQACNELGVKVQKNMAPPRMAPGPNRRAQIEAREKPDSKISGLDRALWQEKATAFMNWCHERLLETPEALAWLEKRGLPLEAARRYRFGWNPGERGQGYVRPRSSWGLPEDRRPNGKPKKLWLPIGWVVPALADTAVAPVAQRLRIRRTDEARARFLPEQKYFVVPGSNMEVLYLSCTGESPLAVLVVESELDAYLLHYLAGDLVSVLAVGTSNIASLQPWLFAILQASPCILVALDFDAPDKDGHRAGAEGAVRWLDTFPRARRLPPVGGKDPGEAYESGENLRLWILAGLPAGLRFAMSAGPSPLGEEKEKGDAGQKEEGEPAPPIRQRKPWECLSTPAGPQYALRVLGRAGLRVEAVHGDYVVHGHDNWPPEDFSCLLTWLKKWGDWVRWGLYGPEAVEVRVSPQSSSSTGQPDEDASDQDNSQPSYCVAAVEE